MTWLGALLVIGTAVLTPALLLLAGLAALGGSDWWALGFLCVPGWWLVIGLIRALQLGCRFGGMWLGLQQALDDDGC